MFFFWWCSNSVQTEIHNVWNGIASTFSKLEPLPQAAGKGPFDEIWGRIKDDVSNTTLSNWLVIKSLLILLILLNIVLKVLLF